LETILDAVNDREEGIKNALLQKMQEKKCKTFADNQRILQEARMERDMLKMHVKLKRK
jgi:F-type H+-transporting ATPase subunit b